MISKILSIFRRVRGKNVKVKFPSYIGDNVYFKGNNYIGRFSHITQTIIGYYSYIGRNCVFSNCKIGSFCSISSYVRVIIGTHPSSNWVSTHPLFFSKNTYVGDGFVNEQRFEEFKTTRNGFFCEIGNDVWIGTNVTIMQGVTIGDGAIIGANSIVTKDIPAYAIVVGCPARIIRYRFSENEIIFLKNLKWWNWDLGKIIKLAPYFDSIEALKQNNEKLFD